MMQSKQPLLGIMPLAPSSDSHPQNALSKPYSMQSKGLLDWTSTFQDG